MVSWNVFVYIYRVHTCFRYIHYVFKYHCGYQMVAKQSTSI